MTGRNEPCWCGSGKKMKKCHPNTPAPQKDALREKYRKQYQITLKNEAEIHKIRKACQLASEILEETCKRAKAGVTTQELNDFAHEMTLKHGATPAALHYGEPPFPGSICISLNDVICHGIPGKEKLKEGDILNIDVAVVLDGFYGDCSKMVTVGNVLSEVQNVVDTAYNCLMDAIAVCKPGAFTYQIGDAITDRAEANGCSVVYQFCAHGVGIDFHENPQIFHNRNSQKIPMAPGMTFTIEPMINGGKPDALIDAEDGWTARTPDGKVSAQFEHTLLITETGHELLTTWKR